MTLTAPHLKVVTDRPAQRRKRWPATRIERVAVVASLVVIAASIAVDVFSSAPSHAAAAPAAFATVAPPAGWKPLAAQADEQWAADESARGTDPNAAH